MNKFIVLVYLTFGIFVSVYSQELSLIDLNIGDEIYVNGEIVFFNGWSPHVRMKIDEYIIGIDENKMPSFILENLFLHRIKGLFKLKLISYNNLPYYKEKLMIFEIIEYENIELLTN